MSFCLRRREPDDFFVGSQVILVGNAADRPGLVYKTGLNFAALSIRPGYKTPDRVVDTHRSSDALLGIVALVRSPRPFLVVFVL
jgi:hypothetical protein